jgi:hypothetical protein
MPNESPAATPLPLYLPVTSITDPKLRTIPPLASFQSLEPGEQALKSYQIRVRRPKFPWLLVLFVLLFGTPLLMAISAACLYQSEMAAYYRANIEIESRLEVQPPRDGEVQPPVQEVREPDVPQRPEPPNPWVLGILCAMIVAILSTAAFFVFRQRGHTFLYVTNRRLIVLELNQGLLKREQAVLNFNIRDISGFQLLAQRGLRKLFGVLLLREKRTFYLSIATRSSCQVQIGAVSTQGSRFEPGIDSVALCGQLDAQVLALRTAGAA